jgi:hypothetical protein
MNGCEHVQTLGRLLAGVLEHSVDQCRRAVEQVRELRFEALGETVEHDLNALIRRSRWDAAARARRKQVCDHRMVGLFFQPLLVEFDRLVALAEHAVGQAEHPARVAMARGQRRDLAVADHGLLGAVHAGQQNTQVVVRVDEFRIELEGSPIGRLRFDRLTRRPQQDAEVVVGVEVLGIERNCSLVRGNRIAGATPRVVDDAEVAVAVRLIGLQFQTALDQRDPFVAASLVMCSHATIMQHIRMVRLELSQDVADALRVVVVAGHEHVNREPQRLVETDLALYDGSVFHHQRILAAHKTEAKAQAQPWSLPKGSSVVRVLIGRVDPAKKIVATWMPHGSNVEVFVATRCR